MDDFNADDNSARERLCAMYVWGRAGQLAQIAPAKEALTLGLRLVDQANAPRAYATLYLQTNFIQ